MPVNIAKASIAVAFFLCLLNCGEKKAETVKSDNSQEAKEMVSDTANVDSATDYDK